MWFIVSTLLMRLRTWLILWMSLVRIRFLFSSLRSRRLMFRRVSRIFRTRVLLLLRRSIMNIVVWLIRVPRLVLWLVRRLMLSRTLRRVPWLLLLRVLVALLRRVALRIPRNIRLLLSSCRTRLIVLFVTRLLGIIVVVLRWMTLPARRRSRLIRVRLILLTVVNVVM